MKKTGIVLLTIFMLAMPMAMAAPYKANDKDKHLYLFEKNPTGEWPIVEGGAWGKANLKSGVFNGHGLEIDTEYCLINYEPDEWGKEYPVLACGMTDEYGNIHLRADFDVEGKVWLVLSSDIDVVDDTCTFNAWNPAEYLFENDLLPLGE